jgi:PAS domain S-box-containing protein
MAPPSCEQRPPAGQNTAVPERTPEQLFILKAAVLDAAWEPIVGIDVNGRIICWNAAAEHTFGHSSAEATGQLLAELIIPARLRAGHLRGFGAIRSAGNERIPGRRLETWARRSDNSELPVEIAISSLSLNGAPIFIALLRDLSNQRRTEAELQRLIVQARETQGHAESERKRLQEIFATSPYLVLVTEGANHCVRFSTPSALDVFRAPPDVFGKPLAEAYPEFAEFGYVHLFSRVYETGEVFSGHEIPLKNRGWGDAVRYFDYRFQPLRGDQGKISGVIGHGIEVTDKVIARQRLEEALKARDDFVSLVSHELRNPLNVLQLQIASSVARLNSSAEPMSADMMRQRLAAMERTMTLLSSEVDRLLEVSRMVRGSIKLQFEEFDLGVLAQEVVQKLAAEASGCPTFLEQSGGLQVTWDRTRIGQALSNLLSNAYKYGAGKPVRIRLEGPEDTVRLEVQDAGAGIPAADQERIFERFVRGQARPRDSFGGLGLGLWMCRQIVEEHGGRIWVQSAVGSGSRFIVELPRRPKMNSDQASTSAATEAENQ